MKDEIFQKNSRFYDVYMIIIAQPLNEIVSFFDMLQF
jgi:hypothetical protein